MPPAAATRAALGLAFAAFCAGATAQEEDAAASIPGLLSVTVSPEDAALSIASISVSGETPADEHAAEDAATGAGANAAGDVGPAPFVPLERAQQSLAAGDYLLQATRPGYRPATARFTIESGKVLELPVDLERRSSVLRLRTSPTDARILIDGQVRVSRGPCPPHCWIEDVPPGEFEVEVASPGFRSWRAVVQLPGPRDIELPPIVLEAEEGVITFLGLPDEAEVRANGAVLPVDWNKSPPEASLVPGAYALTVVDGAAGAFETSVVVGHRRRVEVDVGLRPVLALLEVLDADPLAERAVHLVLDAIAERTAYAVELEPEVPAEATGAPLPPKLGLDAAALRDRPAAAVRELDWAAIRERIEREMPASLYLLAVPDRPRDAERLDLWLLAAAPGPSRPDIHRLRIRSGQPVEEDLAGLLAALAPERDRRVPRIGATLVESLAGAPLAVAGTALASPAYRAGIEPGMELIAVGGEEIQASGDWNAAVAALAPGDTLLVTSSNAGGGESEHLIEPEWGWTMLDAFDPELLPAATAAHLLQELQRPGEVPRWLLELDLAAVLFAKGDVPEAVRRLRGIEAPGRGGLGRETVNYLLGLALSELAEHEDPEYGNQAVAVFRDLEAAENSRLESDRGPGIADRARLHSTTSLALLPPQTEIVVGEYRAEVRISGGDIATVRFLVDGRPQATASRAKAWATLRMARYPTQQIVSVEGLDADGKVVATDELVLNQQRGDLRVRIEEPAQGADLSGATRATAAVVVPKGREVSLVEFRVGETVQAELQRPPWRTEINVPRTRREAEPVYLTVTATLDDGSSAEDVRFLSAAALTETIDVDLVELYTTVIDRSNRPVTGLSEADFTVLEDGVRQQLATFEQVRDLPLTLGVAIDTSASMTDVMEETRQAAAQFVTNLLRPADSLFAVSFATRPHLLMGQTSDVAAVVDTIGALRASGRTALHDALMTGLYYFRGVRGRRALVVLSDGEDTSSSASYADVLEYARHSEVVIYTIGLGIDQPQVLLAAKLREMAEVTGGRAFFISAARELRPVYRDIERELRAQYLLAYNSNQPEAGTDFRTVEVRVTDNRRARTISGYYP